MMYDLYMTHGNNKLGFDYINNEVRRAQNEISSERIEEYTVQSICSLEFDMPVYAEHQGIQTCKRAFSSLQVI
jgi:hypothetical protein